MKNTHKNNINNTPLIADERGLLLINMAFMILVLGGLFVAGTQLFQVWSRINAKTVSDDKQAYIQNALEQFYSTNQRYPCPAPLDAPIDGTSGATNFGVEISDICPATGNTDGTFAAAGRPSASGTARSVRIGAVPVRTLGIPDDYIFNSDKQRFVYAVTTNYADRSQIPFVGEEGAITIQDRSGNISTSDPGNVVHLVMSPGKDKNGTYDFNGNQIIPCNASTASGENCDNDAVFVNSIIQSDSQNNVFTSKILYKPHESACQNANVSTVKDIAFLIDSSTSMRRQVAPDECPDDIKNLPNVNGCSRMDVAHWAMRKVVSARLINNASETDPRPTSITGFKPVYDSKGNRIYSVESVKGAITDGNGDSTIVFDDPTDLNYQTPDIDDALSALETTLTGTCPTVGGTPLGIHLEAVGKQLGAGDTDRPNKIVVISDGRNNKGNSVAESIAALKALHGNDLEIDIVSMVDNQSLADAANIDYLGTGNEGTDNGVTYYETKDPDSLKGIINQAVGLCSPPPTSNINHQQNCN